ncbi:MAG: ribosome maturation factor RimM [Candidatus Nanopelagicales bacterium]
MRVVVARVGRALGVKGDLLVDVLTDEPERRLVPGAPLFVAGEQRSLRIESTRPHGGRLCVHFVGVDDRSAAEALTGLVLEAERAPGERPEDPDEYYDDTLVGLDVVTLDGQRVGAVTDVLHLPGQDVLAVREQPDAAEILIPFVSEIVPVVDVDGGRIIVAPPEGLLDPDESADER